MASETLFEEALQVPDPAILSEIQPAALAVHAVEELLHARLQVAKAVYAVIPTSSSGESVLGSFRSTKASMGSVGCSAFECSAKSCRACTLVPSLETISPSC